MPSLPWKSRAFSAASVICNNLRLQPLVPVRGTTFRILTGAANSPLAEVPQRPINKKFFCIY